MTPSTRRHIFLLVLGLACLYGVVFAGCAIQRDRYEWFRAEGDPCDWYRWERVERAAFPLLCGTVAPDGFNSGGACVLRLNQAVLKAGDTHLHTGAVASGGVGRLCLIFATMTQQEAERMTSSIDGISLADHEIEWHGRRHLNHRLVRG